MNAPHARTTLPMLTVAVRGSRVLLIAAKTPHGPPLLECLPYAPGRSTTMVAAQFATRVNKTGELVDAARSLLRAYAKSPHTLTADQRAWMTRLHEVTQEIEKALQ